MRKFSEQRKKSSAARLDKMSVQSPCSDKSGLVERPIVPRTATTLSRPRMQTPEALDIRTRCPLIIDNRKTSISPEVTYAHAITELILGRYGSLMKTSLNV